ncbi:MAG: hypothetical protein D6748_05795 [Calditrichaeota bacterium]|nr:MAG: hypothetical protein D6748_05795 [Calditrichota bacterium]
MHYGSLYTETDYEVKSHILNGTLSYQLMPSVALNVQGTFSKSSASFDPVEMPQTPLRTLAEEKIHLANYDYSTIHSYSDLDYQFLNLRLGLTYAISKIVGWDLVIDYYDLTDNQGYVYGVESGTFYVIRTGFSIYRSGK